MLIANNSALRTVTISHGPRILKSPEVGSNRLGRVAWRTEDGQVPRKVAGVEFARSQGNTLYCSSLESRFKSNSAQEIRNGLLPTDATLHFPKLPPITAKIRKFPRNFRIFFALGMLYGGAPAGPAKAHQGEPRVRTQDPGPAGTGKTVSGKNPGRTLGILVVFADCSFCSEEHECREMAKIKKSLS